MPNWNYTSLAIGLVIAAILATVVLLTRQERVAVGLPGPGSQKVYILSPSFVPLPGGSSAGAGAAGQSADPPALTLEGDIPLQSTKAVNADGREAVQLLARDAIAPIYFPEFSPAGDVGLKSEELVIGVEIGGDSRAYPIGPLRARDMVNDVVAGVPILVTW